MKFEIPTDFNPYYYDNDCVFYSKHFIVDGEKYDYDEIVGIIYEADERYMNGIRTSGKAEANFYFTKSNDTILDFDSPDMSTFSLNLQRGIIPNRNKTDNFNFVVEFLTNISFQNRLSRYLNFLKKDGYFIFGSFKFYDNGDIYTSDVLQGNIRKAFKEEKLIFGDSFSTYKHSQVNPYRFGIIKGSKYFGLAHDIFEIKNCFNKDIFDLLVKNCIKNGNMSEF
jgi:hypothetical protein